MKNISIAQALAFTLSFAMSSFCQAFDPPERFRGVTWGSDKSAVSGLQHVKNDSGVALYSRRGDKLEIGGGELTEVLYGFYRDQFGYVVIQFAGTDSFYKVKEALFQTYGLGYQDNQFMHRYLWGLNAPVSINFEYKEIGKTGHIIYTFVAIDILRRTDIRERGREAKTDF